jgi:hypothetical protein
MYSALHYIGASAIARYAMQEQQGGGAGEEERRRDEGTGEGTKEGARAVGGEATGAWVIGGRGGREHAHAMEHGGRMRWKGLALWRGG